MPKPRVSLRDWPRITRFYGIGPEILARMPNNLIEMYAEQLIELSAEEALLGFLTSDMPHLSATDRRSTVRRFEKYIPEEEPEQADLTTAGGRAQAARLGIVIDLPGREIKSEETPTPEPDDA